MDTKIKAKDILDYCISYISNFDKIETIQFQKKKRYKEMLKEIEFMIDNN